MLIVPNSVRKPSLEVVADCFVQAGSRHLDGGEPCQDYALAREESLTNPAFAVIADGCSASPKSELGAAFNCVFWEWVCRTHRFQDIPGMRSRLAEEYLNQTKESLLNITDTHQEGSLFDATMLGVVYDPHLDRCLAAMCGDGHLISVYRTQAGDIRWEFDTLLWHTGMPAYPSYLLDEWRLKRLTNTLPKGSSSQGAYTTLYSGDREGPLQVDTLSINEVLGSDFGGKSGLGLWVEIPRVTEGGDRLLSVSVCSDGVTDIRNLAKDTVYPLSYDDHSNWVKDFLTFPNPVGRFQFRQARRALSVLKKTSEMIPFDDFSIATLMFKETASNDDKPGQT